MTEKTKFNDQLRAKMSGKSTEEKPAAPEELVERAATAIEELQSVIAELAVTPAGGASEEEEKTK